MGYYNSGLTEDDISEQEYCYGKSDSFFGTQTLADAMNAGLSANKIGEGDSNLNTDAFRLHPLLEDGRGFGLSSTAGFCPPGRQRTRKAPLRAARARKASLSK